MAVVIKKAIMASVPPTSHCHDGFVVGVCEEDVISILEAWSEFSASRIDSETVHPEPPRYDRLQSSLRFLVNPISFTFLLFRTSYGAGATHYLLRDRQREKNSIGSKAKREINEW